MTKSLRNRKIIIIASTLGILFGVSMLFAPAQQMISLLHTHSYNYGYFALGNAFADDTDTGSQTPAIAVPILMYHGVRAEGELGTNTTRENFIAHMEMLKKEGFETVSVKEYAGFREGTFTLPPKPILITFDDGRKDSYYTVDTVLKRLDFKATIFVATDKPNKNDLFFLSWDELKTVQKTGRWEIEAHGQRSHDEVPIDSLGTQGRYLTSRIYTPSGTLESIEDFEKRVEDDYIGGIVDLYTHLGIDSYYYAVPLNDYGTMQNSNYDKAIDLNKVLTEKYFKLAFIEVPEKDGIAQTSFYNYIDTNPHELKRLEVKNISDTELLRSLEKFAPSKPLLVFPDANNTTKITNQTLNLYGGFLATSTELIAYTNTATSTIARTMIGDNGWQNYTFDVFLIKGEVREASLFTYYADEDNYVVLDWDTGAVEVVEKVHGVSTKLFSQHLSESNKDSLAISLSVREGQLSVTFGETQILEHVPIQLKRGAAGFGLWDPNGGYVRITSLTLTSL